MFCESSKGLALKQRYGDIRVLVQAIQQSYAGLGSKGNNTLEVLNDDIIIAAIKVLANQSKEVFLFYPTHTSDPEFPLLVGAKLFELHGCFKVGVAGQALRMLAAVRTLKVGVAGCTQSGCGWPGATGRAPVLTGAFISSWY